MAQRKPPPSGSKSPAKATSKSYVSTAKKPVAGSRPTTSGATASRPQGARPPVRKPGKSIVNQKQRPWGLIWVTVAVVVFAAVVVTAVVVTHKSKSNTSAAGADVPQCTKMIGTNATSYLNELQCAKDIKGVQFTPEANRQHVNGVVKYDASPPVGGNHSPYWANCTGTIYSAQIANENAVHMLEHGAVWITYNPKTLPSSGLAVLKKVVAGHDRMALSPYAGLKTPISLQAWGYQLFVNKATDPRIQKFVDVLRYNPQTTPEATASCSDPYFDPSQSTPGHPQDTAA